MGVKLKSVLKNWTYLKQIFKILGQKSLTVMLNFVVVGGTVIST